jgi:hypothetical protein
MATTSITNSYSESVENQNTVSNSIWDVLAFNYYSLITVTITFSSIVGGIACMYILQNEAPMWQLVLCSMISMGNNVAGISQAPVKWVVAAFIASVLANALLILMNI